MSYKHILVAVDLTNESRQLVAKAAGLAKATSAELSFIHIDANNGDQIAAEEVVGDNCYLVTKGAKELIKDLADNAGYPVKNTFISNGKIEDELETTIRQYKIDLVVCGHHQDLWHNIMSSAKKVIHQIPADILVVPFNERHIT